MEPIDPPFDMRIPAIRVEDAIAHAVYAAHAAARAHASQLSAIDATLMEARAFPEVFTSAQVAASKDGVEFAVRAAIADLAVQLSISEQQVRTQAAHAAVLSRRTPLVWAHFREGDISVANAVTIADTLLILPDAVHAEFEAAVLDRAITLAPARFRTAVRGVRERIAPESFTERHERDFADRALWVEPQLNGMSTLSITSSADDICRAEGHIDRVARHLVAQPDEARTLTQLRVDVARDLLAGVLGSKSAVGVSVAVTVPVLTLLGGDEPGILHGHGPIDPDTARRLAAHAPSFIRLLTHPVTGAVLQLDRTTYRPPADLARWVQVRGYECDFIGCGRLAADCDIDHITEWHDGGTTDADNLHLLCRNHHRVKTQTKWKPTRQPDTSVLWTSPTGHQQSADPPPF